MTVTRQRPECADRTTARDRSVDAFEPSGMLRAIGRLSAAYRHLFATSRLAPLLSQPNPVRRIGFDLPVVITQVRSEAAGVVSLTLADPEGGTLPRWVPGAHIDVFLPSGRQRQYSLCGDPGDHHTYRIAIRRLDDGAGGSREIHEQLRAGDQLTIRGPRNAFRLIEAPSYLFIAGGIGITPILPMVQRCHEHGVPWRLVYLGRTRPSLPFVDELMRYDSGVVGVRPDDETGRADITSILSVAEPGAAIYLCGPTPLMTTARGLIREINPTGSLHTERFSPLPVRNGSPFTIWLARSGSSVSVAGNESALSAIRRTLPGVAYSCQQGFCGTCKARVLDGEVDHRDRLLTPGQRAESMLICVSRAQSQQLTLDL